MFITANATAPANTPICIIRNINTCKVGIKNEKNCPKNEKNIKVSKRRRKQNPTDSGIVLYPTSGQQNNITINLFVRNRGYVNKIVYGISDIVNDIAYAKGLIMFLSISL